MKQAIHRTLLLTAVSICAFAVKTIAQVKLTPVEAAMRKALNIPANANRVVIFSHDAHMDWDWLNPFPYNQNQSGMFFSPTYFGGTRQPADSILSMATQNLLSQSTYYYSVCEMGFLRGFANNKPALFNSMKNSGRLAVVGGGITSPDNLLPNGETFIRDYLVANQWLKRVNVPWSQQAWLPDDFGHDPQLPVMLQAMDAMGVGFARIPGACNGMPQAYTAGQQTLLNRSTGGVDFRWAAADSSETVAHWLQSHYNQGANIDGTGNDFTSPETNLACQQTSHSTVITHIRAYINTNGPVSPTPYIFVEVSDDFMTPYQKLVDDVKKWNTDKDGYTATGVYAVVATFDHYVRFINQYPAQLRLRSYNALRPGASFQPFQPNPYWMGYYASRPELKTLHNEATRSLLAAETFQSVFNTLIPPTAAVKQSQVQALLNAWDTLAPSTHHDFITGTAVDGVYQYEQLPLLNKALSLGNGLKSQFTAGITSNLSSAQPAVAVFNPLGFSNAGVIEYEPAPGNKMLLNVSAPSLGYAMNDLAAAQRGDGSLRGGKDGRGNIYLQNTALIASVNMTTGNLVAITDRLGNKQVLAGNGNGNGNEIIFYNDGGDIYRFGYEEGSYCTFNAMQANWTIQKITADTLTVLGKSVTITKIAKLQDGSQASFTIIYSLRQGEPFLRISTTGSAPDSYTIMVKFPLNSPNVDNILAGTPYHWNSLTPMNYGTNTGFNSTMWATHDFVILRNQGLTLAAIYHASTPAWTTVGNNLYGVILRNTPNGCNDYGADGSDTGTHTQEYALRIPTGLREPASGFPLKEARYFNTPMEALPVTARSGGRLPSAFSLASTSGNAIITAAKWNYDNPNALILRVYQPNNARMNSTLNLSTKINYTNYSAVSALELPLVNAKVRPSISKTGTQYTLTLPRALSTFKLE